MFGWFARKPSDPLLFENNQDAFDYACRQQNHHILLEALIPALVLESGTVEADGARHFLLRLADRNGGRELWGCTLKEAADFPEVGDLVAFRVVKIASDLPVEISVIGFIAAKLLPELVEKKGWRILKSYTPDNIKQAVRW